MNSILYVGGNPSSTPSDALDLDEHTPKKPLKGGHNKSQAITACDLIEITLPSKSLQGQFI